MEFHLLKIEIMVVNLTNRVLNPVNSSTCDLSDGNPV